MSSDLWEKTQRWEQSHKPYFTFSKHGLLCPICANWCEKVEFTNPKNGEKFHAFGCAPHGFLSVSSNQFIVTTTEPYARGEDGDTIGNIFDVDKIPYGAYRYAFGVPARGY